MADPIVDSDVDRTTRPRAVPAIWAIGVAGLVFRLWLVLGYRPTCDTASADCFRVNGDALYHHGQASLMADGHWFKNPLEFGGTGTLVESAGDPPAYALILSFFSRLGMDTVTWHRSLSTLFGFALIVLVGLLTRRIAGDLAGMVAATLAALHPLMWINDMMLMSESLYQPLVVVVLWAAHVWVRTPDRRRIAWLGLAIAAATLTRAEALTLYGFLVVPLVWWTRDLVTRERIRQIVVCGLAGLALIAPWVIYNNIRFERPVTISAVPGTVWMAGSCDSAWAGEWLGFWSDCFTERGLWDDFEEALPGVTLPVGEGRVIYDESVRDDFNREHAWSYTVDNWYRYPKVALARMGRSLDLFRVGHTLRQNYELEGRWEEPSILGLAFYYSLIPLTAVGAAVMWGERKRLTPLLSMWPTIMFASATTFGLTRYRVPIDIAMIVLAAVAVAWLWPRVREAAQR